MAEIFPNLMKTINLQILQAYQNPRPTSTKEIHQDTA